MDEPSDAELDLAAENVLWFQQAIAKVGGDKLPQDTVGTSWLNDPLYHIAPDAAMDADWDNSAPTWILYALKTGLQQEGVAAFSDWWDEHGHQNADFRDMVYEAMGHVLEDEEWARRKKMEDAESEEELEQAIPSKNKSTLSTREEELVLQHLIDRRNGVIDDD